MRFRRYGAGPFNPGGGMPGGFTTGEPDVGGVIGGFTIRGGQLAPINTGNPLTVTGLIPGRTFVAPTARADWKTAAVRDIGEKSGAAPASTATVEPTKVAVTDTPIAVPPNPINLTPGEVGINRGDKPGDERWYSERQPDPQPEAVPDTAVPTTNEVVGVPEGWWSRFKPYLPLAGVGVAGLGVLVVALTRE